MIREIKEDLIRDWAIAKIPMLMVVLMDFSGFLTYLVQMFPIDKQFTLGMSLLVVLDLLLGGSKALMKKEFDFKKFGEGIIKKIWKYGGAIVLITIMKGMTIGGEKIDIFQKADYLVFIAISSIEGNSNAKHLFGYDLVTLFQMGRDFISKTKNPNA